MNQLNVVIAELQLVVALLADNASTSQGSQVVTLFDPGSDGSGESHPADQRTKSRRSAAVAFNESCCVRIPV
jgi:hypothetical protein